MGEVHLQTDIHASGIKVPLAGGEVMTGTGSCSRLGAAVADWTHLIVHYLDHSRSNHINQTTPNQPLHPIQTEPYHFTQSINPD